MTDDYKDAETPNRPKWIGWALAIFMLMIVFGVANVGWLMMRPAPLKTAQDAGVQANPELAAGRRLVETSDCMRCHGFERSYVGPTFADVGKRYAARADGTEYIARKIREGGGGEWGRNLMPRHPQITEAQALQMAQWIVSLSAHALPSAPVSATQVEGTR